MKFLVLDPAPLWLASWLASLVTYVPGWACTKEKLFELSWHKYLSGAKAWVGTREPRLGLGLRVKMEHRWGAVRGGRGQYARTGH